MGTNRNLEALTRHQIHPMTWRPFTFLPNFNLIRVVAKPSSLNPITSNNRFPPWRRDSVPLRLIHQEPNQFQVRDECFTGSITLNLTFGSSDFPTRWNYCTCFLNSGEGCGIPVIQLSSPTLTPAIPGAEGSLSAHPWDSLRESSERKLPVLQKVRSDPGLKLALPLNNLCDLQQVA